MPIFSNRISAKSKRKGVAEIKIPSKIIFETKKENF